MLECLNLRQKYFFGGLKHRGWSKIECENACYIWRHGYCFGQDYWSAPYGYHHCIVWPHHLIRTIRSTIFCSFNGENISLHTFREFSTRMFKRESLCLRLLKVWEDKVLLTRSKSKPKRSKNKNKFHEIPGKKILVPLHAPVSRASHPERLKRGFKGVSLNSTLKTDGSTSTYRQMLLIDVTENRSRKDLGVKLPDIAVIAWRSSVFVIRA